jgi:hypothetical protein
MIEAIKNGVDATGAEPSPTVRTVMVALRDTGSGDKMLDLLHRTVLVRIRAAVEASWIIADRSSSCLPPFTFDSLLNAYSYDCTSRLVGDSSITGPKRFDPSAGFRFHR